MLTVTRKNVNRVIAGSKELGNTRKIDKKTFYSIGRVGRPGYPDREKTEMIRALGYLVRIVDNEVWARKK
jgi:hypothetical protein